MPKLLAGYEIIAIILLVEICGSLSSPLSMEMSGQNTARITVNYLLESIRKYEKSKINKRSLYEQLLGLQSITIHAVADVPQIESLVVDMYDELLGGRLGIGPTVLESFRKFTKTSEKVVAHLSAETFTTTGFNLTQSLQSSATEPYQAPDTIITSASVVSTAKDTSGAPELTDNATVTTTLSTTGTTMEKIELPFSMPLFNNESSATTTNKVVLSTNSEKRYFSSNAIYSNGSSGFNITGLIRRIFILFYIFNNFIEFRYV